MSGNYRHGPSRPERAGTGSRNRSGSRHAGPRRAAGEQPRRDGGAGAPGASGLLPDQDRLAALIGPVVGAAGLDLEAVRVSGAGRRVLLRVVVDADGGVALDDIADVSRDVSAALDASVVMGAASYTLEVSSPGVDRPLTEPRHWRRAVGRLVTVPLPGGDKAATVAGRVVTAGEDGVTLDVDGARRSFGYAELGPGRVQVEFGRSGQAEDGPDGGEPDGH